MFKYLQNELNKAQVNNENASAVSNKQEKATYGRLRVLTAPPTSVNELTSESSNVRNDKGAPKPIPDQRRNISSGGSRRANLRPSSGSSSTRFSTRDHSITQYALIDDENVSALQQITRGGGAVTLASQWKSQFDDSEETDNEWKQDGMSQSHNPSKLMLHGTKHNKNMNGEQIAKSKQKSQTNGDSKEKFSKMREMLPHCWSEPLLANKLRYNIEPPILQKTTFDDIVSISYFNKLIHTDFCSLDF